MRILPEPVAAGTANASCVVVTDDAVAAFWFSLTVVAPGAALKFVPVTVTAVPGGPAAGVNPVIVGTPGAATTKSCALVAVLPATVTAILPVAAPAGTATVSVGDRCRDDGGGHAVERDGVARSPSRQSRCR